jgi:hypothetical protein
VSIGAKPLEALVTEALFAYVDGGELRAALARRDDGQVQAIRGELRALDVRRRELVEAFAGGGDAKALRMATDALDATRKGLEAELGAASSRSPLEEYESPGVLRAAWPTMTSDQRRSALSAAFGEITVEPAAGRGRRFDPRRVAFGKPG